MTKDFTVIPFPSSRQAVIDAGRIGVRRHVTHGLIELDVTTARRFIREHKVRTGEGLSFASKSASTCA